MTPKILKDLYTKRTEIKQQIYVLEHKLYMLNRRIDRTENTAFGIK